MSDYFKQLITQINTVWSKLANTQKILIIATAVVSILGMAILITWSSLSEKEDGYTTLFVNLESEDAASVTELLKEMGVNYRFENNGRTLSVPKKELYEIRMEMARNGLPKSGGQGFELFDKLQLGMTDFVQNLNYQRALEGELIRSIETILEVDKARVHITIPKPSLFKEKKEEATASVVVKLHPGKVIREAQVRGITHLVASSVEGLLARQVTVLNIHGELLTKGFADNAMAEQADHNMALQHAVETHLERKITEMFEGLLGPNKAQVKVSAILDFEKVEKTVESYSPAKVIRSQQRNDGQVKNSPVTGDEQKEGSITNYEIDKTAARIFNAPGTRKRITVSVAVDGEYEVDDKGKKVFKARKQAEIDKFTQLVKNTVGYSEELGDQVYVTSLRFDRNFFERELKEMEKIKRNEMIQYWAKIGLIMAIILMGFFFLRNLARNIARAMNPPLPKYAGIALEPEDEEIPEELVRQNELLEKVENLTHENPLSVATLLRAWLRDEESIEKK